jgi:DNA-binding transcriptional LysR family regulator
MIKLHHLRYFVAVAEELHFGRAAARLHIAQPGLSQQIQEFERAVGVRLLERTRRRVELTPAGQVLLSEGRRALAHVDRAVDLARRTGRGEVGRLTLASIGSATYDVLPGILREYRRRYPEVELVLREMSTPAQARAVRIGEIDVGFLRLPADVEDLATRVVREEGIAAFLWETHPLAEWTDIPLRAFAEEPLILFPASPRPSWADVVIGACRDAGFEPHVVQEAIESATVVSLVAAGIGVALVPEGLRVLSRPGVVYREIAPPAPRTALAAVYRVGEVTGPVRALLEVVEELWPTAGEMR